jgi:integrase
MNSLTLSPDFDLSALDRADLADGTRRNYKAAILLLIASNVNPMDYNQLIAYADSLVSSSARSNLKSAYKIITDGYVTRAKLSNGSVDSIQRFIWLCEELNKALTVTQPATKRTPHWLSQDQVNQITAAALQTSMRDYIVLAVLLGAGLRREELASLTFDDLAQIPTPTGMQDVITVIGKGDKRRTIPINPLLAGNLREWQQITGGGRVARRIRKNGKMEESLSTDAIEDIVRKYGNVIGISDLEPHDCRRSYGRLMYYANDRDIMQVMRLLGHARVATTQRYIGVDIDLDVNTLPTHGLSVAGD